MGLSLINTSLIATCLSLISAMDWNSNPNRTALPTEDSSLLRLHPSSLEECLDTCVYHKECQSVDFTRLVNSCLLQSKHEPPKEKSDHRGINFNRNAIEKRQSGQPTAFPPKHKYTKACPLSDFTGYRRLGNRNRPGDHVILVNYGNGSQKCTFTTFVCGENAEWLQTGCRNKSTSTDTAKPRDCNDIGNDIDRTGNPSSGVFEILPDGVHDPVRVFCDFNDPDGPWTVIQRRVDDIVDFYRNYREYQAGFGNLHGNFWLGLDKISSITLQDGINYTLKVTVEDKVNGTKFAKYSHFQVMNASTGYRLQVGGYMGNAGDSLTAFHNGQPFTTFDRDMDINSDKNCAKEYSGAWWFNGCHMSNLNGNYSDNTYGKGIIWYQTTGYFRSATFASMKIKDCR